MFSLISFLKNFSRMKHWWREELQLPATIKRSFSSSYKWQKLFERYTQLRLFPKQILLPKLFYVLNHFHLMNMNCEFFQVFLMEMFDLQGKELKYAKELLLNHYRKSVQNSMRSQDMWVELKLQSRITHVRCFEVVYARQANAVPQPG